MRYECLSVLETLLTCVSIHTPAFIPDLSLLGHTIICNVCKHFFPKIKKKRESFFQDKFSESSIQGCSLDIKTCLMKTLLQQRMHSLFNAFLQNTSTTTTTTKRQCRQSVSFETGLTAELGGVLAALSNRYHLDIFNSSAAPNPTCKLETEERGVSKT